MIELEIYAVGLRESDNILKLGHQFEAYPSVRYQIDTNHDIVYLEMDEPLVTQHQIADCVRRIGLITRFVGEIPSELEIGTQTQRIE